MLLTLYFLRSIHETIESSMFHSAPLTSFSCGSAEEPYTKETFPVTGKVTVDGKEPGSPIKVMCHKQDEIDTEHPTISGCQTANDGSFEIATYTGDGMPEGKLCPDVPLEEKWTSSREVMEVLTS